MPFDHEVKPGDCISSIAYIHGFAPETIWIDPRNATLRARRKNPNTLLPGEDFVHVRDKRPRNESGATNQRHRFKRIGVPELLRVRLLDENGKPRTALPFELQIHGGAAHSGQTDGNGVIAVPIPPDAAQALLVVRPRDTPEERYELQVGHLHPWDKEIGMKERLENLGFYDDTLDVDDETLLKIALRMFQDSNQLPPTGEADQKTIDTLRTVHGS